jgi:hypothetical protein
MTSVEFFIPPAKAGVDQGASSVAGYLLLFPRCLPLGKKLPGPRSSHDRGPLLPWFRKSTPRVRRVPAASGGMTISRPPVGGDDVDLSSPFRFRKQRNWMIGHIAEAHFALGTVMVGAVPPVEALAEAEAASSRALELDRTLAEAHTIRAVANLYSWRWPEAEDGFRRALELNPSYASAHSCYAIYLAARGKVGEAIHRIYRAREFDPLSPHQVRRGSLPPAPIHSSREFVERGAKAFESRLRAGPSRTGLQSLWRGLQQDQRQTHCSTDRHVTSALRS